MVQETSLHFQRALLPTGWSSNVRAQVRDGVCIAVSSDADPLPGDDRHAIALSGIANLHSHAFQRGMAGTTERRGPSKDSFWTWRETMYRFVDRLDPDDLADIAAMAYVEMLETGFTRVGEFHYLHHDRDGAPFGDPATMSVAVFEAAQRTGIAVTHLPVFYAHGGFGGTVPGPEQRRFANDLDSFARLLQAVRAAATSLPDAIVGLAPHSLRAVTPAELGELVPLADGQPVHIHIAEQVREVEDCLAWCGARPVEWLLENAPVDGHWCLVHATHMTDTETVALARTGAVAGLCPITEANLGDGLFNARSFLNAGGAIGIGSDSNVLIDASEELRLLEYGQRLVMRERNVLAAKAHENTGRVLFDEAVSGGAQALGVATGIAAGRPLDIVSLRSSHPSLTGKSGDELVGSWIFAAGRGAVDCVWRRGEKVVSGGVHRSRDAVEARFRKTMRKLL